MEFLVGAKAQLKLDVITKVEQGKIPRKQARQILGKSERTLERYIASFRKEGVVFVRHGNQGKKPRNRIDDDLKKKKSLCQALSSKNAIHRATSSSWFRSVRFCFVLFGLLVFIQ